MNELSIRTQTVIVLSSVIVWLVFARTFARIVSGLFNTYAPELYDPFCYWIQSVGAVYIMAFPFVGFYLSFRMGYVKRSREVTDRFYSLAIVACLMPLPLICFLDLLP